MNQNNVTRDTSSKLSDELSNELVNSNNSEDLNPHYYANENYNQHGAYDPNFNSGLSSYAPNPMNLPSEYDENGIPIVPNAKPVEQPVLSPLLQSQAEIDKNKKKKKIIKISLIVLVVIAVIVAIIMVLKAFKKENILTYETLTDTDSFFIENSQGNYALFNEEGKQLSEFVFDDVGNFYGGVAKVENKDGRDGIIKENGEYLVPLSNIKVYGNYSLYEINNKEKGTVELKNIKGEVIAEGSDIDVNSFAYGALFAVTVEDGNGNEATEIFNYAGSKMGTLNSADDYDYYSYDGSFVALISDDKTVLYNIDKGLKVIETDGTYCITDTSESTVILNSCSTWSTTTKDKIYKVVRNGKIIYTADSTDQYLTLSKDGAVFTRERYGDYYKLLDDNGNVKQDFIIGYQSGKDYVVEQNDRLMFYKNNQRRTILDCASYYQVASDQLYIIKVDRYADGCKGDVNHQYGYYDLAGNEKSDAFYSATAFNEMGRAIVSTDHLERYVINDKFEVLGEPHYSMRAVGNMYIVWDEKHNQALIDQNAEVVENVVEAYDAYGSSSDDESYVIVTISKNNHVLYDSQNGKKITTFKGTNINMYEHYFIVDGNYYSYKTGKIFYSKN